MVSIPQCGFQKVNFNSQPLKNKSNKLFPKLDILLEHKIQNHNPKIKQRLFSSNVKLEIVNEICLVEIRNSELRHLIDQSRKSKISRDHELVNEIKSAKANFNEKRGSDLKIQ